MSGPSQPPLWTWTAGLLLAAVTIASLLVFDARTQTAFLTDELNLPRLGRATPPGTPRIVVIGSSKTECAFAYDQDMEARFHRAGRDVSFTRIAVRGAQLGQLAYSFDAVARSHPQLVLIEADLLTLQPGGYNAGDGETEQVWQSRVRQKLKMLVSGRIQSPNDPTATAPCDRSITQLPEPTPAQVAAALAKRRVSSAAEQRPYLDLLDRLRAQGSAVGMVDIPPSPDAARSLPPRLVRDRTQLSDRLTSSHRLIHFDPGALPASAYIDRGHLNAEGRERVSQWFVMEALGRLGRAHA